MTDLTVALLPGNHPSEPATSLAPTTGLGESPDGDHVIPSHSPGRVSTDGAVVGNCASLARQTIKAEHSGASEAKVDFEYAPSWLAGRLPTRGG